MTVDFLHSIFVDANMDILKEFVCLFSASHVVDVIIMKLFVYMYMYLFSTYIVKVMFYVVYLQKKKEFL